ncbi:hypothetical protein V8B97DRAFT_67291 [Scleroderma yunnanense]
MAEIVVGIVLLAEGITFIYLLTINICCVRPSGESRGLWASQTFTMTSCLWGCCVQSPPTFFVSHDWSYAQRDMCMQFVAYLSLADPVHLVVANAQSLLVMVKDHSQQRPWRQRR